MPRLLALCKRLVVLGVAPLEPSRLALPLEREDVRRDSVEEPAVVRDDHHAAAEVLKAPSYAGIGFGGEGHTTFTIAGPTGEGLTSARSFTRRRRCVMVDSFRII